MKNNCSFPLKISLFPSHSLFTEGKEGFPLTVGLNHGPHLNERREQEGVPWSWVESFGAIQCQLLVNWSQFFLLNDSWVLTFLFQSHILKQSPTFPPYVDFSTNSWAFSFPQLIFYHPSGTFIWHFISSFLTPQTVFIVYCIQHSLLNLLGRGVIYSPDFYSFPLRFSTISLSLLPLWCPTLNFSLHCQVVTFKLGSRLLPFQGNPFIHSYVHWH